MTENVFDIIKATEIASRTHDAYMYNDYGESEWIRCISFLLSRGVDAEHAEMIVRSKHMRWAEGHACDDPDIHTLSQYFVVYFDEDFNQIQKHAFTDEEW